MILYAPDERIPSVDTEDEDSADKTLAILGMPIVGTLEEKIRTFRSMGFVEH